MFYITTSEEDSAYILNTNTNEILKCSYLELLMFIKFVPYTDYLIDYAFSSNALMRLDIDGRACYADKEDFLLVDVANCEVFDTNDVLDYDIDDVYEETWMRFLSFTDIHTISRLCGYYDTLDFTDEELKDFYYTLELTSMPFDSKNKKYKGKLVNQKMANAYVNRFGVFKNRLILNYMYSETPKIATYSLADKYKAEESIVEEHADFEIHQTRGEFFGIDYTYERTVKSIVGEDYTKLNSFYTLNNDKDVVFKPLGSFVCMYGAEFVEVTNYWNEEAGYDSIYSLCVDDTDVIIDKTNMKLRSYSEFEEGTLIQGITGAFVSLVPHDVYEVNLKSGDLDIIGHTVSFSYPLGVYKITSSCIYFLCICCFHRKYNFYAVPMQLLGVAVKMYKGCYEFIVPNIRVRVTKKWYDTMLFDMDDATKPIPLKDLY